MAEKYRFFDAVLQEDGVTYDREYDAQEFTDYFKALVTTGLMKSAGNQLKVTANGSNMITKIDTGIAFLLGRYYENDSFKELTHDTETLGNSRIDRIVIRMDLSTEARYVKAFIKKGVPSANPVPPALTQTPNLYEISLAQVKVVGGQTFIATNAVTDERGKDVICPWAGSNILPNFNDEGLTKLIDSVTELENSINPKSDTVVYVNGQLGTDSPINGSGKNENAYKTINYALNRIKKLNIGNVRVFIEAGQYNEYVAINGFNGGRLTLISTGANVLDFIAESCNSLTVIGINSVYFVLNYITNFEIKDFATLNTSNRDKFRVLNSRGTINNGQITGANSGYSGLYCENSEVTVSNVSGSTNNTGINAVSALVRLSVGVTLTGSTPRKTVYGGQILT